jgi:phage-related protein
MKPFIDPVVGAVEAIVNIIKPFIEPILYILKAWFQLNQLIVSIFQNLLMNLASFIAEMLEPFMPILDLFTPILDLFAPTLELFMPILDAFTSIVDIVMPILEIFTPILELFGISTILDLIIGIMGLIDADLIVDLFAVDLGIVELFFVDLGIVELSTFIVGAFMSIIGAALTPEAIIMFLSLFLL